MPPHPHTLRPCGHEGNSFRASVFPQVAARSVRNQGPAADRLLRVAGRRQEMQVPGGGQTFSAEALENPPLSHDPGGTDTAIAADGERQETVRENLGVRDAAGLAVGERFSLTNRPEAATTTRRTKDLERRCHFFPVSLRHKVCRRCRAVSDERLRDLSVPLLTGDTESFLCYSFSHIIWICSLK